MSRIVARRVLTWLTFCMGPLLPALAQAPGMPFGLWAEVASVSDKWIVIQNELGQQFPVALTSNTVGLFLVRWPTTPNRVGADCIVEATGLGATNNVIAADHADVFRGTNQLMVAETIQPLVEPRPLMNPGNIMMMNIFGPVFFLPPGEINAPRVHHVVGFCVANDPIQIMQGGNIRYTIVANTMTEVTRGTPAVIRPGDLAFCLVDGWNGRSLRLEELVIYKPMPIDRFVP